MKKNKSDFAVFGITFVISLAVLMIVMMLIFSSVLLSPARLEKQKQTSATTTDLSLQHYRPTREESFSILVICCGERSDPPREYFLLQFDPVGVKLVLTPFPAETEATVNVKTNTINGHYDYAGSQNALLAAESIFLTNVDRYLRISDKGAINLINAIGGLTWEFPQPFASGRLQVPAGTHLLDGESLSELMQVSDGITIPEGAELLAALLRQQLDEDFMNNADRLFQVLLNNSDSNLTQFDFSSHKKALRYYLTHPDRKVEVLPLKGEWNEKSDLFSPEQESVQSVKNVLPE